LQAKRIIPVVPFMTARKLWGFL